MKIGFITSWAEKCGVSEYSKVLVQHFIRAGHEVLVAGNYPKSQLEPDLEYVKRFFHCPFMTNETTADVQGMLDYLKSCDVVHVQFETSLYHESWFPDFITKLKALVPKIVLTMHSAGVWQNFPFDSIDHFISHSQIWFKTEIFPMPVVFYDSDIKPDYKSIISYGLGRNDDGMLQRAIEGTDLTYRTTYGHHNWLPKEDLVKEIQKSWIVSLLYPDSVLKSSSSAVLLALGCSRPALITDTVWFQHVRDCPNLFICNNSEEAKGILEYLTDPEMIPYVKHEMKATREWVFDYGFEISQVLSEHLRLYKE